MANTLWHSRHLCVSAVDDGTKCNFFLCATISRFRVNDLPQMSQWWFFIPVWVTMCRARSPDVRNPLLQTGQIWSRTPVWIFLCAWKLPNAANCFEHTSHWSGRSPVWVLEADSPIIYRYLAKLIGSSKGNSPDVNFQIVLLCKASRARIVWANIWPFTGMGPAMKHEKKSILWMRQTNAKHCSTWCEFEVERRSWMFYGIHSTFVAP